jgi:hypothetical protein
MAEVKTWNNKEIMMEPIVLRDFSAVELYPKRYETISNKHYLDIIYGLFEKFVFIVAISGKRLWWHLLSGPTFLVYFFKHHMDCNFCYFSSFIMYLCLKL